MLGNVLGWSIPQEMYLNRHLPSFPISSIAILHKQFYKAHKILKVGLVVCTSNSSTHILVCRSIHKLLKPLYLIYTEVTVIFSPIRGKKSTATRY